MQILLCMNVFVAKVIRVSQARQVFQEEVCLVSLDSQVHQVFQEQRSDQKKKKSAYSMYCAKMKQLLHNYKWNLKLHDTVTFKFCCCRTTM